jgi:hypothetical protein
MLKAFQKSILSEYSDDLTTFHWKTVVYWVSETWSHSLFVDTQFDVEANISLDFSTHQGISAFQPMKMQVSNLYGIYESILV